MSRAKTASEIVVMVGLEAKQYGMAEVSLKEEIMVPFEGREFCVNHIVCYEDEKGHSQVTVVGDKIERNPGISWACVNYNKFNAKGKKEIIDNLDMNTVKIHNIKRPAHRF